jgi:F0F1-type ATP synthase membrane subunit b/b'
MNDRSEKSDSPGILLDKVRSDVGSAAGQVQQKASEALHAVQDNAGQVVAEAKSQGVELLDQAQSRAEKLAEEGKDNGAEQGLGLSRAIRHAADDLEDSSPDLARHVRAAAGSLQGISEALRDRSAGQLIQDATDFARRQPTIFFAAAALAGFALVRFARSSASNSTSGKSTPRVRSGSGNAPGWTRENPGEAARPATLAAATLGGAAAHQAGEAEPGQMPTSPDGPTPMPRSPSSPAGQSGTVPNEKSESPL